MPPIETLTVFAGAALVLLIIPGPAVTYIVMRALTQGTPAGFLSMAGLAIGTVVHVAAAAIGVSALFAASPVAFEIVKFAGAGYLIWLGIQKLRERSAAPSGRAEIRRASAGRIVTDGVIVNLLNPKGTLFFLAFLPQFADPERGSIPLQILFLGIVFLALSVVTDGTYVILAGRFARALQAAPRALGNYLSAGVYLGLGFAAALSGTASK